MLEMDKIQYLAGLHKFEGKSLRAIAKQTGHHFDTVKKYVDREDWNEEVKPRKTRESKLDPLKPIIDRWLREDLKMPRKQRHTGKRIYERLSTEPEYAQLLEVGLQTVTNYVSRAKKELCKSVYDTAILGEHPYGQAQLDFGDVFVYNPNGVMTLYHELILSFPASNAGYVQLCKTENAECLLEAMQRIFEHIGAVPTRILFDNMSAVVTKILPQKQRKLTDIFSRFILHHSFKAEFCNPGKGNEKGSVENKVGYKRRNFFVPMPTVYDLGEFNRDLLKRCDEDMNRLHYRKQKLISELFKEDVAAMLPLPNERFRVSRLVKAKTDKYSFVDFDNNTYSAAPDYYLCNVWLEISAEYVRVLNEKYEEITVHERKYTRETDPMVNWGDYLSAIRRKPNSFKHTAFFKQLPIVWQEYFRRADYAETKKMIEILTPIILDGKIDDATVALEMGDARDAEEFLVVWRSLTESPRPKEMNAPNTPKLSPYKSDLSVYSSLIGGDD